jgi:hypothetical protein
MGSAGLRMPLLDRRPERPFSAAVPPSKLRAIRGRRDTVSSVCELCAALERLLRDLKLEIEKEIQRRELGFSSLEDEKLSRRLLDKALESLAQTEAAYERHKREHGKAQGSGG